jgi:hypothetical protein
MITVAEIEKKAERMYPKFLKATLLGDPFFPCIVRSDKSLSDDFVEMSKEVSAIISGSKDRRGFGYVVQSRPVNTRSHGVQDIPESIVFEDQENYLLFIGKVKEFDLFIEKCKLIESRIPKLTAWIKHNPQSVIDNHHQWEELLKVCDWFLNHFEPNRFYIRELPITIHTKFIEENKAILRNLLDELIPEKVNVNESVFEKRLHLKYVQPEIRFRYLKPSEVAAHTDLSVPLDEFSAHPVTCKKVFIVENKMNFLTFPEIPESLAIWGKGFAIESLKNVAWLNDKEIYYWSDLDVQGFQMLSQLRSYFQHTKSFLMDGNLFERFGEFVVHGTPAKIENLANLSESEAKLFNTIKSQNIRLEQERIPHWVVVEELRRLKILEIAAIG